MIILKRRS